MFKSIRWRMVASYLALALLTATAVGVLALLLVQRHVAAQQRAFLRANAEAIASQSALFMQPVALQGPLQQLAQTAAFLGDARVRILDANRQPVVDSNQPAYLPTQFVRQAEMIEAKPSSPATLYFHVGPLLPPDPALPAQAEPVVWTLAADQTLAQIAPAQDEPVVAPAAAEAMAANVDFIVVQRSPSMWGDRLSFAPGVVMDEEIVASASAALAPIQTFTATVVTTQSVPAVMGLAGETAFAAPVMGMALPAGLPAPSSAHSQTIAPAAGEVVTATIQTGDQVVGFVELQRQSDWDREPMAALRRALWVAAGGASLLALAFGLLVSRGLTAPIESLALAAGSMSRGDLTARAPVRGGDELGALARQFNQMANRLQHSFVELAAERDALRRFIADASHELRTPITALRTFNELLQGPAAHDVAARAEFLVESQEQIGRLEWITRNLLDLSRLDGGIAALRLEEHSACTLLETAAAPFLSFAQEAAIELSVVLPSTPQTIRCDGERVTLALINLLDNALKFTPAGGRVETGVAPVSDQGANQLCFWVQDTGLGVAAEEQPLIFERFYRSPRTAQPGSGLGLAIVQSIVHAHGGRVELCSQVDRGSRFMVYLPKAN
jgi:signal transduction histidine kinase